MGRSMRPLRTLSTVLEMVKIEHTLFALPFAFLGMLLAAEGWPSWRTVLWIAVAMVGARSAAMGFNRLVDRKIDAANPRTAMRALPAGLVTPRRFMQKNRMEWASLSSKRTNGMIRVSCLDTRSMNDVRASRSWKPFEFSATVTMSGLSAL